MNQELRRFIDEQKARTFNNLSDGYDFLEEGEIWALFKNPNGSADLMWRLGQDCFYVFYGQWYEQFDVSDESATRIVQLSDDIMNDRCYLWQVDSSNHRMLSLVSDEPGAFYTMARETGTVQVNGKDFDLYEEGIDTTFIFWDPSMMDDAVDSCWIN